MWIYGNNSAVIDDLFDQWSNICCDSFCISYVDIKPTVAGVAFDIDPWVVIFIAYIINPVSCVNLLELKVDID